MNNIPMPTQEEIEKIEAEAFAEYRRQWRDFGFNIAVTPFDWRPISGTKDPLAGIHGFDFGPFHINILLPWTRERPQ